MKIYCAIVFIIFLLAAIVINNSFVNLEITNKLIMIAICLLGVSIAGIRLKIADEFEKLKNKK